MDEFIGTFDQPVNATCKRLAAYSVTDESPSSNDRGAPEITHRYVPDDLSSRFEFDREKWSDHYIRHSHSPSFFSSSVKFRPEPRQPLGGAVCILEHPPVRETLERQDLSLDAIGHVEHHRRRHESVRARVEQQCRVLRRRSQLIPSLSPSPVHRRPTQRHDRLPPT